MKIRAFLDFEVRFGISVDELAFILERIQAPGHLDVTSTGRVKVFQVDEAILRWDVAIELIKEKMLGERCVSWKVGQDPNKTYCSAARTECWFCRAQIFLQSNRITEHRQNPNEPRVCPQIHAHVATLCTAACTPNYHVGGAPAPGMAFERKTPPLAKLDGPVPYETFFDVAVLDKPSASPMYPDSFKLLDTFEIKGRGTAYVVEAVQDIDKPAELVGRRVLVDGSPFFCRGVERVGVFFSKKAGEALCMLLEKIEEEANVCSRCGEDITNMPHCLFCFGTRGASK